MGNCQLLTRVPTLLPPLAPALPRPVANRPSSSHPLHPPPGEVFDQFLKGATLEECYAAVAAVANRWLDMLDTRVGGAGCCGGEGCEGWGFGRVSREGGCGWPLPHMLQVPLLLRLAWCHVRRDTQALDCAQTLAPPAVLPQPLLFPRPLIDRSQGVDLTDEELVDHISEMCVMSKSLEEYEGEGGRWPLGPRGGRGWAGIIPCGLGRGWEGRGGEGRACWFRGVQRAGEQEEREGVAPGRQCAAPQHARPGQACRCRPHPPRPL